MPEIRIARCRSCGAPAVWMKTQAGNNMLVDADSVDEAELDWKGGRPLFDHKAGHVSHFATCPQADQHRRR